MEELTPERFDARLYDIPQEYPGDWTEAPKPFTVTVAGPERHDGEKPYTYVLDALYTEEAWVKALAWHMVENIALDAYVVASQSHEGLPPEDAGYQWNDLRPNQARSATITTVTAGAKDLTSRYDAAVKPYMTEDGDVDPDSYRAYDETRADYGEEALELVYTLAETPKEES